VGYKNKFLNILFSYNIIIWGGNEMSLNVTNKERLLLRRQFILGPRFIEDFPTWRKIKVSSSIFLTVHPELETEQVLSGDKSITLLGYILDPYEPLSSNFDICKRLISQVRSADDIFRHIENMGGRFVIILNYNGNLRVFTDTIGFRPVYYKRDSSGILWCASQPGSIAKELGLEFGKDTWNEFLDSRFFQKNADYWYPGDCSPFKSIFHLLPNHYLDLNTGETVRFWPTSRLNTMPLHDCVEHAAEILQKLMRAAHHRFKLALALTAGYDTRLLLASGREICKNIIIFTQVHPKIHEKHMDIRVARILLSKLGLKHTLVRCPSNVDENFLEIYKMNFPTARLSRALSMYCQYKYWDKKGMVLILGTGGELFRCKYGDRRRYSGENSMVSGKTLARFTWMRGNAFAINQYERWLSTTKGIWKDYGINILDLFHWEQRKANWASMNMTEADIAHESFFPYNCRRLLTILLSAEEKYRMPPKFELNRRLIAYMWPEILEVPINPYTFQIKVKRAVRTLVRRFGLIG